MTVSGHPAPGAPRNVQLPLVTFASSQVSLKGEDVILVAPRNPLPGTDAVASQWDLPFNLDRTEESIGHVHGDVQFDRCDFGVYAVFDGHNGVAAATHCKEVFLQLLIEQLPDGAPPLEANVVEYQCWREDLQRALAVTFAQMQHTFAGKGVEAGTTATVVLQVGWLITCANVGDSLGFIDTGAEILQLTADHRIDGNIFEQARVTEAGGVVSTVDKSGHGPAPDPSKGLGGLRVWPGGMANSRAIGDFSAGQLLLSSPNITQMLIPPGLGARLVIASDGVWDGYYGNCQERVAKLVRRTACASAATKIISTLVHSDSLRDDTSVVVIDLTTPGSDFPQMVSTVRGGSLLGRKRSGHSINSVGSSGSGKSCCFSPSKVLGDDDAPSGHPSVSSSMKAALTVSTDPSVSATSSVQSAQLQVFTEVDVAYVLDQLPSSVPAPRGGVPHWPQPRLSMAMLETQEEAHSVFARAAIQRRSIGMAGLSRGGSSSLLNLLACDMEERSVRRSRAFGSSSFDPSLSKEFAGFPRLSSGTGYSPTSTSRLSRNGSDEDMSFSIHLSTQSTELADAVLESDIADLQGSDPRRVSYMQGDISSSGTLRNGCPVGESSMRRLENGMPLKSAMRKSSSSGGISLAVMEMTALQLSEEVKLSGGH